MTKSTAILADSQTPNALSFREYLEEEPLLIKPTLASALGVNASLVFGQLHYWLKHNKQAKNLLTFREDRWWSFNSYRAWQESNFPFWSEDTIYRIFRDLESLGLVASANLRT